MFVSLMAPAVQATDSGDTDVSLGNLDGVIVGDNVVLDNVVIDNNTVEEVKPTVPNPMELLTQTTEPVTSPIFADQEVTAPENAECACGGGSVIAYHADDCVVKTYYHNICDGSAGEIYARWERFSKDGQSYILDYLQNYHAGLCRVAGIAQRQC